MRTRNRTPRPAVAQPKPELPRCRWCGHELVRREPKRLDGQLVPQAGHRPWFCPGCKRVSRKPA